jgi:hypothetical protein
MDDIASDRVANVHFEIDTDANEVGHCRARRSSRSVDEHRLLRPSRHPHERIGHVHRLSTPIGERDQQTS